MRRGQRDKQLFRSCVVLLTVFVFLVRGAQTESRELRGRAYFTYQNVDATRSKAEFFSQNLEVTIRDRLFEKSNLMLSIYLDNARNLRRDLTTRRYHAWLELSGLYYNFSIHYSPRQKITPLEVESSRELTDKQFVFGLTLPNLPQLRLFYAKKRQFTEGEFTGLTRSMRADLRYKYKFADIGMNRWNDTSTNTSEYKTSVTGGHIRISKSLFRAFNLNSGYEYILTESKREPGLKKSVSNHTLTSLMSGRYGKYLGGSLSIVSRWLHSSNASQSESRNNNISMHVTLFPTYPARLSFSRDYLQTKQDTIETLSDYATAQLVLSGKFDERTTARVQLARRFVIRSSREATPSNTYYLSVASRVYRGVDLRADLNIAQREVSEQTKGKYKINSILEIYTKPRKNLQISSSIQFHKYSSTFSLLKNDRAAYNLRSSYTPAAYMHLSIEAERSMITSGSVQTNNSLTLNSSINWSQRLNFNISYALNATKTPSKLDTIDSAVTQEKTYRKSLNLQSQLWVSRNGILSINYSRQIQEKGEKSRFFTISYRLNY